MDDFIKHMQQLQALSSWRLDDQVARQGVAGHQFAMQFVNLGFARDAFGLSAVEAHAAQGLSSASMATMMAGLKAGS